MQDLLAASGARHKKHQEAVHEDKACCINLYMNSGDRNVANLHKGSYISHANTQAAAPPCKGTGSDLGPQRTLLNKMAIY